MTAPTPLAGSILCGGLSRRMGRDKARLMVGGVSLLDRAISRLRNAADPVILATGATAVPVPGCLAVADPVPGLGPLGGLAASLRASPHHLCAVVAVDMPGLSPVLLRVLTELHAGEDALVPRSGDGQLQPLHAVYARSALGAVSAALAGPDLSLRNALAGLRIRVVDAGDFAARGVPSSFAENLNTDDDVTAWRAGAAL